MESRANYIVVGLFVIGLIAALVLGIYWLTSEHNKVYRTYEIYMNEPVSGLSVQAPVKFNGVDVGYVSAIQLNPVNPQQVDLLIQVEKSAPVNQSTIATLMIQGITGITYIGLNATATEAPPLVAKAGEPYPVIRAKPSLLVELSTAVANVSGSIKNVSNLLGELLNDKNLHSIQTSLANLANITKVLSEHSGDLIQNSNKLVKKGHSVLQNVSQQTLPNINQAADRLSSTLDSLQQLTNEIKQNPAVLIRGKKPPPPGPGE